MTVESARFDQPSLRGLGAMQRWPADPKLPPHMYGRDAPSFGSGTAWARTLDWDDEHMCDAGAELLVSVRCPSPSPSPRSSPSPSSNP